MIYITLDRECGLPFTRQIYAFLREAILDGRLKPDEKLPSTRELKTFLGVSRNVVIESYEQLAAEGYAYTKGGSGTYVSKGVLWENREKPRSLFTPEREEKRAKRGVIAFRTGIPDMASIPVKKWAKLYRETALDIKPEQLGYQNPYGEYELRYQLCDYLRRARGVNTTPEHILITNGAAQAFSLLCGFVRPGEYALAENPLSYGILHTLESRGVPVETIPVDSKGMMTEKLPEKAPKLIFTTPSHQFPTGAILPVSRRIEMVRYAKEQGAYIVEDDYDSEFRFRGSPVPSMQNLEPERVIYVGTFSKTLMPALRLGYMVLPEALRKEMEEAKYVADLHSPVLEQLTLARFLEQGLFERHIKKMRGLYFKRKTFLCQCLKETFGDRAVPLGADAGLHLMAKFQGICFQEPLMKRLEEERLELTPVRRHYLNPSGGPTPYDQCVLFGYGNTDLPAIAEGINRLKRVLIIQ